MPKINIEVIKELLKVKNPLSFKAIVFYLFFIVVCTSLIGIATLDDLGPRFKAVSCIIHVIIAAAIVTVIVLSLHDFSDKSNIQSKLQPDKILSKTAQSDPGPVVNEFVDLLFKKGGKDLVYCAFNTIKVPIYIVDESRHNVIWLNNTAEQFYGIELSFCPFEIGKLFEESKKHYSSEEHWEQHSDLLKALLQKNPRDLRDQVFLSSFFEASKGEIGSVYRLWNRIVTILFERSRVLKGWVVVMPITSFDHETMNVKDAWGFLGFHGVSKGVIKPGDILQLLEKTK